MRCAVRHCGNNNRNGNKKNWRYFHFPKDKELLKKWIEFCERDTLNTATACICNEHFTSDDFERNMQYELGFTRKNPTKLKPGSCPSIHRPQDKLIQNNGINRRTKVKELFTVQPTPDYTPKRHELDAFETNTENETFLDFSEVENPSEGNDRQHQSYKLIECISTAEDNTNPEISEETPHIGRIEIQTIDPVNPQDNIEENMDLIELEGDNYAKHLESEVSSLRREVFFLKDERKKLIDEIESLRATLRSSHLKHIPLKKMRRAGLRSPVKKAVVTYTASIDIIRKLRAINRSTD